MQAISARGLLAALFLFAVMPAEASPRYYGPGYSEWNTNRPYSGFAGFGRFRVYCDYIKYPKRSCHDRQVCRNGNCWTEPVCKVTGWEIRQSCY